MHVMSEIDFVVNLSAEPVEDVLVDGCVEVVDDDAVVEYAACAAQRRVRRGAVGRAHDPQGRTC